MSERCPPLAPSELTNAQRPLYDTLAHMAASFGDKFTHTLPNGALIGPFNPHLRTPEISTSFWQTALKVFGAPGLTPKMQEVITMLIAAHLDCKYMLYCHSRLAKVAGFDKECRDALARGEAGSGETRDKESQVANEVATALITEKGGLRKDIWDRGVETVGSKVLYSAIQLVGLYHHQAFVLNGFDIGYPEDEDLLV
ncbi:hypothetical protein I307_03598 [Cryptococcus deuterogattii 99/473]|uniref:Carboxymuconolactone decarboxylase-like domain-containing protein n=1 Tax=Cryptococcus deuterogattii Ram5 TaxID=1296110 RepID=A0A0D0V7D8_9TREE|nr:hypothetical protein I313_00163 [Cryptococcus deuterogattii Ram5]KIY56861.1 hypothetical protein I307_03598 [Cryptococcus deuterogattii 99/473]